MNHALICASVRKGIFLPYVCVRIDLQVLRKPTTDRAGSSEKRVSSGSGSGIAATAKTRGLDHGAAALNAIAAWKPQKPSWSIATNAVFRERHRHGPLDKAGSVYEGLHRLSGGEEVQRNDYCTCTHVFLTPLKACA